MEKKLVKINDCPAMYVYADEVLDGSIPDMLANIRKIQSDLKKLYTYRQKSNPAKYTPFNQYVEIRLEKVKYEEELFEVYALRWETDEEWKKRIQKKDRMKENGKKALLTKKTKKEQQERALLKKLKEKYENIS